MLEVQSGWGRWVGWAGSNLWTGNSWETAVRERAASQSMRNKREESQDRGRAMYYFYQQTV